MCRLWWSSRQNITPRRAGAKHSQTWLRIGISFAFRLNSRVTLNGLITDAEGVEIIDEYKMLQFFDLLSSRRPARLHRCFPTPIPSLFTARRTEIARCEFTKL